MNRVSRWTASLLAAIVWLAGANLWAQTAPVVVRRQTAPAYPAEAARAGISGDVNLIVTVGADGRVADIRIRQVPRAGVGFEEAVTAALREWEFSPALQDGVAVEGTLTLAVPFRLFLQGDYLFSASPAVAWQHVKALVTELGYRTVRVDDVNQVLITEPRRYAAKLLPAVTSLGIPTDMRADEVSWYIGVAPGFTRARVTISAVLAGRRGGSAVTIYRNEPLAEWFRDQLGGKLRVTAEPLSDQPAERQRQSPPGPSSENGPCDVRTSGAVLTPGPGSSGGGLSFPRPVVEVKPLFPKQEAKDNVEGKVLLSAVVTEHGSVTRIGLVRPLDVSPGFLANSIAAASMWRFSPAMDKGCPFPMPVTIELSYTLR